MMNYKLDLLQSVVNTFKDFKKYKQYDIELPIKTYVDLTDLLLHTFEVYENNEVLCYSLLDGENVFIKKTLTMYYGSEFEDIKNLKLTPVDFLNACEGLVDTVDNETSYNTYGDIKRYLEKYFS